MDIDRLLKKLTSRKLYVFLIYLVATWVIYFSSRYAGFVTDYIGFEQGYDKCGFLHFYECAGLKNFRYLQHIFSWLLYRTVGSDTIYWFYLYILWHAMAAFISFLFLERLTRKWMTYSASFAFISAFLFLVSPYQNEVVVWKVCIQYCSVVISVMGALYLMVSDTENRHWRNPLLIYGLFLYGIFSLEQTAVMPFCLLLCFLFLRIGGQIPNFTRRFSLLYFLPLVTMLAGFFSLSKIVYGKWVMHYGAGTFNHLFSFHTLGKYYSYFLKYILLTRHWPHTWKMMLGELLEQPIFSVTLTIVLIYTAISGLISFVKGNKIAGLLLLLGALYTVSVLPVIQLYMTMLLNSENDRLGYFSSVFILAFFTLLLFQLKAFIRKIILLIFVIVNIFLAFNMSNLWQQADTAMHRFLNSFEAYDASRVFVLSIPDNYKGVLEFRIYGESSGLQESLQYRRGKIYTGQMYDIMNFNQVSQTDGTRVKILNDSTLHVEFTQNGNWFWHDGIGASSRESSLYKIEMQEYGYNVTFRDFDPARDVIIYASDGKLKTFDWKN
ncbi:MAG TPA: hypothetical protein PK076_10135 [Saprospiraceae bacterium]|nr:hypothetical protein [Saprospiraceae bacterium]